MRHKVDKISKKFDILYDLIRQSRLSHDVLQGLHVIAQGEWVWLTTPSSKPHPLLNFPFETDIQGVNYVGGLGRLNHMVSTSNLSEITSFMSGIKKLLQLRM